MDIKGSIGTFFRSRRPAAADRIQRAIDRMPRGRGPHPKCWSDDDVRRAIVEYALQDNRPTLDHQVSALLRRFGPDRAPGRAALWRLTKKVDALRETGKLD